jgi:outer membrane lipoprotein-sorting protein
MAYDGKCVWVADKNSGTVTRAWIPDNGTTGEYLGEPATTNTYPVGIRPYGLAFDGKHIWVTLDTQFPGTVAKLLAADGSLVGTYDVGDIPREVVCDGDNIYVANRNSNSVTKLRASDGFNLGNFPAGYMPWGLAFDGANLWVTNIGASTLTKLRASDGATLGTYTTGISPYGLAFDGTYIWVATYNEVQKFRASDGGVEAGFLNSAAAAENVIFDGAKIWVTNRAAKTVSVR